MKNNTEAPGLSIVIPVFNEEKCLQELVTRLQISLKDLQTNYEILLVDDGSTDQSWNEIIRLSRSNPNIRAFRFSRNFGHHFAITAGLDESKGKVVVIMDSDLQMRPEDIPKLVKRLDDGFDVVYGKWIKRNDAPSKKLFSWAFLRFTNLMVDLPIQVNSYIFRAMRREVVDALCRCRERSRFVPGLVSWLGFKHGYVDVEYCPRFAGTPKYAFYKSLRLALSAIVSFTYSPLQYLVFIGFLLSITGFISSIIFIAIPLVAENDVSILSLISCFFFLGIGVIITSIGMVGEYVGRVLYEVQNRPLYVISERIGS